MTLAADRVGWSAGGRMIVDGVSLHAAPGRVLAIIGPNGSGKSSLLRLLCRLRKVHSGVVTLDGQPLDGFARRTLARRLAFVEQQATTDMRLSVREVVGLGRTPHRALLAGWSAEDERAVATALARVGLAGKDGQFWHTLSGGERQRAQIARALAQCPDEIVLDEPTNHLDVQHQLAILSLIRQLRLTAIVALHDLNLAALFADEVAVMRDGRIVASGAPAAVMTPDLIQDVFGVAATVRRDEAGRIRIDYSIPHETGPA